LLLVITIPPWCYQSYYRYSLLRSEENITEKFC
jgi:hypothetical protein